VGLSGSEVGVKSDRFTFPRIMQNVRLIRRVESRVDLPPGDGDVDSRVAFIAHDSDSGQIYAVTNNCIVLGIDATSNNVRITPIAQNTNLIFPPFSIDSDGSKCIF
jgi:hypothetical protein